MTQSPNRSIRILSAGLPLRASCENDTSRIRWQAWTILGLLIW
jgi:hypothetical protein